MKLNKLHNQIWYFENVFDSSERFIELIEKSNESLETSALGKWNEWSISGSNGEKYVFGLQKWIDWSKAYKFNLETHTFLIEIQNIFLQLGEQYAQNFDLPEVKPSGMTVSKYFTGKSMGSHVDSYNDPSVRPLMTAILYLNNIVGGELYFKEQNIMLKPSPGSIVIFPSIEPFFHESLTVIEGEKYFVPVFWVQHA